MEKEKVSDHFMRLGMSAAMKQRVERWRVEQLDNLGRVPSFSEAVRMLVERGLDESGPRGGKR